MNRPPPSCGRCPLELAIASRLGGSLTLGLRALWNQVDVKGKLTQGQVARMRGALVGSNVVLAPYLLWCWSDVTAFYLHGRFVAYQAVDGEAHGRVHVDAQTEVDVFAQASATDMRRLAGVSLGFLWSWQVFNLGLGASLGAYNVPALNLIVPVPIVPEIDLSWRF